MSKETEDGGGRRGQEQTRTWLRLGKVALQLCVPTKTGAQHGKTGPSGVKSHAVFRPDAGYVVYEMVG